MIADHHHHRDGEDAGDERHRHEGHRHHLDLSKEFDVLPMQGVDVALVVICPCLEWFLLVSQSSSKSRYPI